MEQYRQSMSTDTIRQCIAKAQATIVESDRQIAITEDRIRHNDIEDHLADRYLTSDRVRKSMAILTINQLTEELKRRGETL